MFSTKEKQFIAAEIENILLSLNHPEMPKEKPCFALHVSGAESWSWADIEPNWSIREEAKPEKTYRFKIGASREPVDSTTIQKEIIWNNNDD